MNFLRIFLNKKQIPLVLTVFYAVGLCLYIIPQTRYLFIQITPYSLLLVSFVIFYHHKKWNKSGLIVFLLIFLTSYFIEVIGVATGKLFGVYSYQHGLGFKILQVPLVIGLNWVVLIYATNGIVSSYVQNRFIVVIGASVLMVLYDIIMENAAPFMMMWMFQDNHPPVKNYLMWFILSLVFHTLITMFRVNTDNRPAKALFYIQFVFFSLLIIFSLTYIK